MVTSVVVVVTGMVVVGSVATVGGIAVVVVATMHPLEVKVYPALHVPQLPLDPMHTLHPIDLPCESLQQIPPRHTVDLHSCVDSDVVQTPPFT